jgi:hypothetical protein
MGKPTVRELENGKISVAGLTYKKMKTLEKAKIEDDLVFNNRVLRAKNSLRSANMPASTHVIVKDDIAYIYLEQI